MDNFTKFLTMSLSGLSTVLLGLIVYGGNIGINTLIKVTDRTQQIEFNQVQAQSDRKLIFGEITAIKTDVGEIRLSGEKREKAILINAAKTDKIAKKTDGMCSSMESYWNKTKCE